jgi:hypothetical protein
LAVRLSKQLRILSLVCLAGKAVEPTALECYAHQSIAHANYRFSAALARCCHHVMVFSGMSPNRFASEHRRHHDEAVLQPVRSLRGALSHIMRAGTGKNGDTAPCEPILFPEVSIEDDPLYTVNGQGEIAYRRDGNVERVVAKGLPFNLIPLVSAITLSGISSGSRYSIRRFTNAAALGSGFLSGLSMQAALTSYAEAKVGRGKDGNPINKDVSERVFARASRHIIHHRYPTDTSAGTIPRHQRTERVLRKLRMVHDI